MVKRIPGKPLRMVQPPICARCDDRSPFCADLAETLDRLHAALNAAQEILEYRRMVSDCALDHPDGTPEALPMPQDDGEPAFTRALSLLTPREREVLELVAQGKSNRQVASSLDIAEKTVKNHLSAVFAKVGAADRTQAVVFGIRGGIAISGAGAGGKPGETG
ncbi:DNA-binding NarL/FixJ family response regulator [Streptomyces olivoverticillatus]|uniref:DNA-binding NarL/FixJ family response regulator n=1 Tax=Streptomyces olivoverticillatus TaxID=66427 RepID=A0A7W7LJ56_9ACTN|nr:LuxR C-terminal-related transcriptional regulator [Streptomyces olivoverticillatus]MBB4891177.1 DNA-binding NarL/FixJ family response regulator [Streptomyces olivoverticillatus]